MGWQLRSGNQPYFFWGIAFRILCLQSDSERNSPLSERNAARHVRQWLEGVSQALEADRHLPEPIA